MARKKKATAKKNDGANGAALGYEAELWRMADALRGSMDTAEYKHVVLGPTPPLSRWQHPKAQARPPIGSLLA